MRRADRLFRLVQLIRGRRLTTAAFISQRFGVSLRSVYRDISVLQAQGVPIEGEAGVGYRMRQGFDLPPLMFTAQEAQALVASVRVAQPRIDQALAASAEDALSKILGVLPAVERAAADSLSIFAPPVGPDVETRARLLRVREAIDGRCKLDIDYVDLGGRISARVVRPLGCFFWGEVWTLAAWCESRSDFRNFRVDRLSRVDVTTERFRDESGKTLADLLRAYDCEEPG
ncbi:MAG: YafY family transcriptional regulator [Lysobacteraceae bacterium]|nr:MAG: YafY family transcriptional regulator [Xanthomonadaceae bacterium]